MFHSVSVSNDLLRRMWSVVVTVFVYRNTHERSTASVLTCSAATLASFALCLVLPFDTAIIYAWKLALLTAAGATRRRS